MVSKSTAVLVSAATVYTTQLIRIACQLQTTNTSNNKPLIIRKNCTDSAGGLIHGYHAHFQDVIRAVPLPATDSPPGELAATPAGGAAGAGLVEMLTVFAVVHLQ
jgi:hypothetical protein